MRDKLPVFWWLRRKRYDNQPHAYVCPLIKSLTILWLRIRGVRADWHSATRADDGRWISPARVIRGNCEITIRVPRRLIMAECNFWNSRLGIRLRSRGIG